MKLVEIEKSLNDLNKGITSIENEVLIEKAKFVTEFNAILSGYVDKWIENKIKANFNASNLSEENVKFKAVELKKELEEFKIKIFDISNSLFYSDEWDTYAFKFINAKRSDYRAPKIEDVIIDKFNEFSKLINSIFSKYGFDKSFDSQYFINGYRDQKILEAARTYQFKIEKLAEKKFAVDQYTKMMEEQKAFDVFNGLQ